MQLLGTDRVLNLRTLKKHYDALGLYLHTPTLARIEQGKVHDFALLSQRCSKITNALDTALSSKVWYSTFATRGVMDCSECGSTIRRRLPKDMAERVVQCWSCPASYTMTEIEDQQVCFEPRYVNIPCPKAECSNVTHLFEKEVAQGNSWPCNGCGSQLMFTPGVAITTNIDA